MLDILRKIGVPTAIATSVSLLVIVVPLLFQIDQRYAKQVALEAEVRKLEAANSKLEERNASLQHELAQNAAFQQIMIGLIAQGRIPVSPTAIVPPARPIEPAPAPVVAAPAPVAAVASAPVVPPSPPPAHVAPTFESAPVKRTQTIEQPQNWRELNDAVTRQQRRLQTD